MPFNVTEASSFRIHTSKDKWIHFTNVYAPPSNRKSQDVIRLNSEIISAKISLQLFLVNSLADAIRTGKQNLYCFLHRTR